MRDTPPIAPIFDGEQQALLIALACTEPPAGFARWTIRLLAEAAVERQIVPKENAAFVASREDVIEVYHRPHDAAKPLGELAVLSSRCLDWRIRDVQREVDAWQTRRTHTKAHWHSRRTTPASS